MPGQDLYEYLRKHLQLPAAALETGAKKLPEDFVFEINLSPTPPRLSRKDQNPKPPLTTDNGDELET